MTVEVKQIADDVDSASQSEMDILNDESSNSTDSNSNTDETDDSEGSTEETEEVVVNDPEAEDEEDDEAEETEDEDETEDDDEKVESKSTFKEISKAYPKLFKEFPDVRKALVQSKQYSELFDTVEDAKETAQKSQVFDLLSNALLNEGNPTPLIENLSKSASKENFAKFAESLLPAIHKHSPESYVRITVPIIKQVLRAALVDGRSLGNKNLENSAKVFSQYLFNSTDLNILNDEPKKEEKKTDPEKEDLKNRLAQNLQAQESKFIDNVRSITESNLVKQIEKYIKVTDKGNNINKFTKQAIIKEALNLLDKKLIQDKEHMRTMGRLREQAARSNFAGSWEPRVSTAYLGRATNLLNGIQRQLVAEALGTKPQNTTRKASNSSTVNTSNGHVPNDPKKVFRGDPKKRMTDREFLDSD